jgi:hypothetical protein
MPAVSPPASTAGRRDAVGAADRLRASVAAGIAGALAGGGDPPPGRIHVGWVAALDVAACPAAFRGQGEDGWEFPGWSASTGAAAVGRAALDGHLADLDRSGGPRLGADPPPPEPLELVRQWLRSAAGDASGTGVESWVAERRAEGDAGTLAALAAGATRWLAGLLRVFGWPLPPELALVAARRDGGGTPSWRPPGGDDVTVACGADARLGRVTGAGRFALVVHRAAGGDDPAVRQRASFEAAAGALTRGIAPEAVVVSAGDTGERLRLAVDEAVLAAGGRMVVAVVEQRVAAAERGFDPTDATPSGRCRWCERREACPAGRDWLAGPGRWRGGLPVL